MPAEQDVEQERYRLGARERRGLLAGWRGGQIASVASGLVVGVALLRLSSGGLGLVGALVAVVAGIGCAVWPVRGRTVEEWFPALGRQAALAVTRRDRWQSDDPWSGLGRPDADGARVTGKAGSRARVTPPAPGRPVPRSTAGAFASLWLDAATVGRASHEIGVVRDRRAGTHSAVLSLAGTGYALLGPDERSDRVGAWARVLAAVAREGTNIHRLQWVERCLPDDAVGPRRHFDAHARGEGCAEHDSYRELLELAGRGGYRHELYLVVTIRDANALRALPTRRRTADAAAEASVTLLAEESASLQAALRHAGAMVHGVLAPAALRAAIAAAFDTAPSEPGAEVDSPAPVYRADAWPQACEVRWEAFRTDATWHATYWLAEWPRSEVGNDFLLPLVAGAGARRTLSVTLAPVAPLRASRDAEHARTSGVADAEIRRRHGFAVTARARRDHDAVLQRESELAGGHASYRFSGFVTVTAADTDQLERSCESVERVAAACQLELRRLYGAQDVGFLATLPLGRGLS